LHCSDYIASRLLRVCPIKGANSVIHPYYSVMLHRCYVTLCYVMLPDVDMMSGVRRFQRVFPDGIKQRVKCGTLSRMMCLVFSADGAEVCILLIF